MRLRRLDLIRFGHFTDTSFDLPAGESDIHIIFGPNEAGKSTALAAIEDLLFSMPTRSPYNFLHDYKSMRIGAVLEKDGSVLERDNVMACFPGWPVSAALRFAAAIRKSGRPAKSRSSSSRSS